MSSPAVHYAKISRINKEGFDITGYLSQLEVFTIQSNDVGELNYNVLSSQEHPTYYLYQVEPVYTTSSYYQVLDYTLSNAFKDSLAVNIGSTIVSNYTNVDSNPNSYFTSSLGTYYFYNTPNINLSSSFTCSVLVDPTTICGTGSRVFVRITRPDGLVLTKDMYDLSGFNSTSGPIISGSTVLSFNTSSTLYPYNPGIIENSSLAVWFTNTDQGAGGPLKVLNFQLNISQSTDPQTPPDNIVVFSPDQVDFFYSDYNPLYGNADINRISQFKMDVDYSNNPLVPINFDQLISGSATRAEVQDSNYASQAWSNIRYNGCESTAIFSTLNDGFNAPASPPLPNTLDSGYGALSPAEKNESFFAYFEGIGGTGPEIIDQTTYLIKWLIDEKGNVIDPEITLDPFTGLQQNVGVINLTDTFEPGKNANVSLISNDPLLTSNPNDDSLTGIHPITHIGRIANIFITETGSNSVDYLRTASFSEVVGGVTPSTNYNFTAVRSSTIDIAANTPTIINFGTVISDPANTFSPHTTYYQSPGTTATDEVQVQFSLRIVLENTSGDENQITLVFQKSTNGGSTWSDLPVTGRYRKPQNTNSNWFAPYYYNGTNNPWGITGLYVLAGTNANGQNNRMVEVEMSSPLLDLNVNDRVRVYVNSGHEYRIFGLDPDGTNTRFSSQMTYNSQLDVTSSYWRVGTFHPAYSRELTVLTASNQLNQIYNSPTIYYQDVYDGFDSTTEPPTPTSKILDFGFNIPTIPFNNTDGGGPLPGDYIRFQYNPNQVYNIKSVGVVNNPSSSYFGNLTLSVFPPIPSTVNLNHFNIYRIINDGSSVILGVPKPTEGYSFTGLLYPQFLSETLQASSSAIVQDLSSKGIIS